MELFCLAFSAAGAGLAISLQKALRENPWQGVAAFKIFAPANLLVRNPGLGGIEAYENLNAFLAVAWFKAKAIIFVGATGIAVRAVAPFLMHKSADPAIVVADAYGRFAISLLAGHWGGGNALAVHVAALLGCQPVITTASDGSGQPALDLFLKRAGLIILDWKELPPIQGALLEGKKLVLRDPWRALPHHPLLVRKPAFSDVSISVDWRRQDVKPGLLRAAFPIVHIGIGMRKGVEPANLAEWFACIVRQHRIEPAAIACLATVSEKAEDEALVMLAKAWNLPVRVFAARELAAIPTPNPSQACARRFGEKPFSVCEGAALASAGASGAYAFLLAPKIRLARSAAFAIAIASPFRGHKNAR